MIAALLISIGVCAFYDYSDRRNLETTEREIAAERAKLKPLAAFDTEVQAFRTKKDALQLRIDIINQLNSTKAAARTRWHCSPQSKAMRRSTTSRSSTTRP